MPSRKDVDALQEALAAVSDDAKQKLRWLFESIDERYPAQVRDALLEFLPALVRENGEQAAAVAADWYEGIRLRETGKRGRVRVKGGYPEDAVTARVRSAMRHAFRGDAARALEVLSTSLDKFVKQAARYTIESAADADRVRWARVPRGRTTCGFCLMLASRGWAYTSEHRAMFRERDGGTYHGNCDCAIVPSFDRGSPEIEGYDPDSLYEEYLAAREFAGSDPVAIADRMGVQSVRRLGTLAERQAALRAGDIGETLQEHEISFYEQFLDVGERFDLIPRDLKSWTSTNDFRWLTRGGVPTELKSFEKPRRAKVAGEIRRSVLAARAHGVTKDTFIVYSRGYPPTPAFLTQMRDYNLTHPDATIRRLYWWSGSELVEIQMK